MTKAAAIAMPEYRRDPDLICADWRMAASAIRFDSSG
jgi:hypothetical protein